MDVVHVSLTPLEGAAWAASEGFREAGHGSSCIAPGAYQSGRSVPTDYTTPPSEAAVARLRRADVVFCHDGWPYRERWYPSGKATVGWFHRPVRPSPAGGGLRGDGWPWGIAAGVEQGSCPGGALLPEILPLRHELYRPRHKPTGRVRIALCPTSGSTSRRGDPIHEATLAAIAGLSADVDVPVGLSLRERLKRMAAAHIVIHDSIAGKYTEYGIAGLALGCVVVNGCDGLHAWRIQRMTGGCGHCFEVTGPSRLRPTVRHLIGLGPDVLAQMGRRNRQWMETAWRPSELIDRNIRPLVEAALTRCREDVIDAAEPR